MQAGDQLRDEGRHQTDENAASKSRLALTNLRRRTSDHTVAGQDANIAELDRLFPANRFDIASLASGHMPFLSVPGDLVGLLLGVAGVGAAGVA